MGSNQTHNNAALTVNPTTTAVNFEVTPEIAPKVSLEVTPTHNNVVLTVDPVTNIINFEVTQVIAPTVVLEVSQVGRKGDKGEEGADGLSAYEIAINQGTFTGTEEEFAIMQASVANKLDKGTYDGNAGLLDDRITLLEGEQSVMNHFTGKSYAIWSGVGLTYDVTYTSYYINEVLYPGGTAQKTLNTSDPTNPRFDSIAVNAGGVIVITGTPSASPEVPSADPNTELVITDILVDAGATTPSGVLVETIYNENTEWTTASNNGTVNFNTTTNPFKGTKHINCGAFTNGHYLRFTDNATNQISDYDTLKFYVNLKSTFASNTRFSLRFYNGSTLISSVVTIASGTYNFDRAKINTYQTIIVPLSAFTFSSASFTRMDIVMVGANTLGFLMDSIVISQGAGSSSLEQKAITSIVTDNGIANATVKDDTFQFKGINGLLVSAVGKVITFAQSIQSDNNLTNSLKNIYDTAVTNATNAINWIQNNGSILISNVTSLDDRVGKLEDPDVIITQTGFGLSGQSIIFYRDWAWRIDRQSYSNVEDVSVPFPLAATGKSRFDIVVLTTNNSFLRVAGEEVVATPLIPSIPENTLLATTVLVTDGAVGQPTPPVTGATAVQKKEFENVILTGSGIINMLELTDEKATIVFKGSVTRLNTISYASVPYNGKRITLFNTQNTPVTIGNSVSGFGVDFVFPNGQDYVLSPNETIEFSFDITYFPYAHHMLIGANPDLSKKADLVGGFVPQSQLPSYVDDILEFPALVNFPATGEAGKIYIAISPKNLQYRWSGSTYVAVTNGFIASTDDVPEGNNKYSTENRVLNYFLTGLSTITNSAIMATDSIIAAFGKLQAQINALLTGKKNKTLAITTEPAITKTLTATDECIVFTNANPVAFTIPTNASVPIPIGTEVQYVQQGAGVVTVGGAGITFVTNIPLTTVQGEVMMLTKIATDTWTIVGTEVSLSNTQTFSGLKTFLNGMFGLRNVANTFTSFFTNSNTASRTYTLPDKNGTVAMTSDIVAQLNGTVNRLVKFGTATTGANSRIEDTGTYIGIDTVNTPTKEITLTNKRNVNVGVEDSDSSTIGRDLIVSAGRTINYQLSAEFINLNQVDTAWYGLGVSKNGDVYTSNYPENFIYIQEGGVGNFNALSQTLSNISDFSGHINGNMYLVTSNSVYVRTNGVGTFNLIQTIGGVSIRSVACHPNGNVYLCTMGGDIYMQTNGVGNFIGLGQTSRDWMGLACHPNGNVYATSDAGDIYMQTNGVGNFIALGQTSRRWGMITCSPNGNVYAASINFKWGGNGDIYMQTNGVGNFILLNNTSNSWRGLEAYPNGNIYACSYSGTRGIYMQNNNALGAPNLDGGTYKAKAGTGKGTGKSRVEFYTGRKTVSGTDMQIETLRAEFNEDGQFKKYTNGNINTQAGIAYTFTLPDAQIDNNVVLFTSANPVTATVPTNATTAFPLGSKIQFTQQGDGVVTVGGAGITFVTNLSLAMVKGETRTLTKIGTDTWTVEGNIPKEVIMPYCVYVDFVNGSDANGKIEDKTKPFKNIDNALSSLPIENGKAWKLVFLSAGNYPCTSLPNRNLEFDSDYLVDIDFTSSALSYVAFGVAKFYRFYGGKISIKSQKVTFQQFAQGNVSSNGVSIEGHINEIKWESPSSNGLRSLIHIDNFRGTILKINKVNTYATNVAGAVFSFTTVNGDYSFLEVLEYSSNISLALIKRISTTGPFFNNVLIGNITGTANCVFGDIDTIRINKASGTGTITFNASKLIFDNTNSTNNFNFGGVGIVTGNLISTNYNAANSSPAALFLNFQGKLNDLRHYGAVSARFVNCVIESNTVLFTNFDTTNLDGRLIFENCILKQVSASEIVKGTASTVHIFGTVKTNQTLSSTLTIINKTPNTY